MTIGNFIFEDNGFSRYAIGGKDCEQKKDKDGVKNYVMFKDGKILCELPNRSLHICIMPDIIDVHVINNDINRGKRVIIVFFADGTTEKAVLNEEDDFSLEQGISICVAKKLLSQKTKGNGSSVYNKIINHAVKVMNHNIKIAEDKAIEENRWEMKRKKRAEKKKAREERKANKVREEKIEIQKEAYLRAMREYNQNK